MRELPPTIVMMAQRGAMFVINHSGGKDSQAMTIALSRLLPRYQLVLVHADLSEVEWKGAEDHIRATSDLPLYTCRSRRSLLQMVEERGMFPSPQQRQCTSDLKRGPIERTIRALVQARKAKRHDGWNLVVNCMGMRADESPNRAKLQPLKFSARNSKAGREWWDWLPIHDWSERRVFDTIREAGQQPHPAYAAGMSRFSCCFCIMASEEDLRTAARLSVERPEMFNDPHLYRRYVQLERSTGQVMLMPSASKGRRTLEDITGVRID